MFKSGYITVIGRSNVGKSTLLNHIIGENLSIISNKPQTTRNKMQIILTSKDAQMIFVDTPGIQKPRTKLGEFMLKTSTETLNDADIVTYIVDHSDFIGDLDKAIITELKKVNKPLILLINKIDLLSEEEIENVISMYEQIGIFDEIITISAANGKNIQEYLNLLEKYLPEGPLYYNEEQLTDVPVKFIIAETVREKALYFLREEIPHGIFTETESMKKRKDKDLYDIRVTIYVEKKSHKGIVIGKNGKMLKKIGSAARKDMEKFLNSRVNLQLWVKIDDDWRNNPARIKSRGFK